MEKEIVTKGNVDTVHLMGYWMGGTKRDSLQYKKIFITRDSGILESYNEKDPQNLITFQEIPLLQSIRNFPSTSL